MIAWYRAAGCVLVAGAVLVLIAILSLATSDSASAEHAEDTPTCSTTLDIDHHGQHVLEAYVGSPGGGEGPILPGGPAAHGHFLADPPVAPGASFCLEESQSPGAHPGP